MPFGLTNGPSIFQELMSVVLDVIDKHADERNFFTQLH